MVAIAPLADRVECIPILVGWFREQWPDYFEGRTAASVEADFRRELNRASLPIRLVAFDDGDGAPLGTVVLRERAIEAHPRYAPGLGGLYVHPTRRSRGVGTKLVRAAMSRAQAMNFESLFAATAAATAGRIFERVGWTRVDSVVDRDEVIWIYRWLIPPGRS
jgi:GNAT superfamily N-acetyltransferase